MKSLLVVFGLVFGASSPCLAEEGYATAFILGEAGYADVDTKVDTELDKKGGVWSLLLGGAYRHPDWDGELSLGFSQSTLVGTSATGRIAREEALARALVLDAALRGLVWGNLGAGGVVRMLSGEGVRFSPAGEHEKWQSSFLIGPQLDYALDFGRRFDVRLSYLVDFSIPKRNYSSVILGISADVGGKMPVTLFQQSTTAAAPIPAPVAIVSQPEPAAPSENPQEHEVAPAKVADKVSVELNGSIIVFKLGSSEYDAESAAVLRAIGKYLKKTSAQWSMLEIGGHTDASGVPLVNIRMSLARAERVAAALIAVGVDGAKIRPVGYGAQRPLVKGRAGGFAPENRRVELQFDGVSSPDELRAGIEVAIKSVRERKAP